MARTIDYLTFMVDVTPYEHEGHNYDALNIIVAYRKGQGFVITWQPVLRTSMGYQTGPLPSRDPLVGGGGFVAKQASRNNVKVLEQMRTNLEVAKEGVKFYFDQRDFDTLKTFMGDVANYGYTADLENKINELINNSKSTVMTTNNQNNESANVQNAQVTKTKSESPMMKQYKQLKEKHPDAMLLFRCGDFYETYKEDAEKASQILGVTLTKHADGYEMAGFPYHALDTYLPKLIRAGHRVAICDQLEAPKKPAVKREPAKDEKPVVVPLSKPGFSPQPAEDAVAEEIKDETPKAAPKKVTLKKKQKPTPSPSLKGRETEPVDVSVPSATSVPSVVKFSTYKTKKGNTAPQIIGFTGEDDPRWKRHEGGVHKWVSASWYKDVSGEKKYRLQFGTRYMDAAQALCEAYNSGVVAAIEAAEAGCQAAYEQAVADGKARWQAKKAEWAAKKAAKDNPTPEPLPKGKGSKGYDDKDVAEMLQAIMAGGDIPEEIKRHMKAA